MCHISLHSGNKDRGWTKKAPYIPPRNHFVKKRGSAGPRGCHTVLLYWVYMFSLWFLSDQLTELALSLVSGTETLCLSSVEREIFYTELLSTEHLHGPMSVEAFGHMCLRGASSEHALLRQLKEYTDMCKIINSCVFPCLRLLSFLRAGIRDLEVFWSSPNHGKFTL